MDTHNITHTEFLPSKQLEERRKWWLVRGSGESVRRGQLEPTIDVWRAYLRVHPHTYTF